MSELYVPIIMPFEHKLVTLSDHSLLHTTLPERRSAEQTAREFAAGSLGLTAIKAIGAVLYDDMIGYAVHTAVDQPYELHPDHRFVVKVHDIDEYLGDEHTSEANAALVDQALSGLPYRRRKR